MQLNYLDLSSIYMKGCDFSSCQAIEIKFQNSNISNSLFSDANLKNAQFREAIISKCCFDRANLQNADFYRVIAKECSFIKVKFSQAQLIEGDFEMSNFSEADLTLS